MPRPTTKDELLLAASTSYEKLLALWDGLTTEQIRAVFPEELLTRGSEKHWKRDHYLRDIVIHLHEWHNLVDAFVSANLAGTPTAFFPEPYTWRNYAELNEAFTARHQSTTWAQSRDLLEASHQRMMAMINEFSNEELFCKKYYPWTGTTSLGSYFVSSTSSHYEWAAKKIRAFRRALVT